jgi:hypothetical protein
VRGDPAAADAATDMPTARGDCGDDMIDADAKAAGAAAEESVVLLVCMCVCGCVCEWQKKEEHR